MKHYFLGSAANYTRRQRWAHTFAIGREKDRHNLKIFLQEKYHGEAVLAKNGRSALAMALKAYFEPGDAILINGLTCYAVYEAVKAAKLVPIFVDVNKKDLNFDNDILEKMINDKVRGIIIQNTLGNPVEIDRIEKVAREHNLTIIEDLAHCTGVLYEDGREAGTVGAATVLSFGKDKSIDTISGGAVVFRQSCTATKGARKILPKDFEPNLRPKFSDCFRARFYPLFGAMSRGLSHLHLGGIFIRFLIKIHWIEKSADNQLELDRKIAKFEAKLALKKLEQLKPAGEPTLRDFYLVHSRDEVMKKLKKAGYYFDGFWYDVPIIPVRYYKKVDFPEEKCPVAVELSQKMINFPKFYSKKELEPAKKIVKEYLEETK